MPSDKLKKIPIAIFHFEFIFLRFFEHFATLNHNRYLFEKSAEISPLKSGKVTPPSNRSNIDFGKLNIQQLCQSSFQFQCFLRIPFIFPRFSCGEFASFVRKFRFCGFVVRPSLKIAFLIPVMMLWHHQFAKSSFTNQAENVVFSSLYEKIGEIVL